MAGRAGRSREEPEPEPLSEFGQLGFSPAVPAGKMWECMPTYGIADGRGGWVVGIPTLISLWGPAVGYLVTGYPLANTITQWHPHSSTSDNRLCFRQLLGWAKHCRLSTKLQHTPS